MDTITTLTKEFDKNLDILDKEIFKIETMIKDTCFNGIVPSIHFTHDAIILSLVHKDYNWTDFVTVRVERKSRFDFGTNTKNNDNRFYVDFSHSSGGWNKDLSVKVRLQTTKDIFTITESLVNLEDELQEPLLSYFQKRTAVTDVRRKIEDIEKSNKIEALHDTLKDEYTLADFESVLSTIKQGGTTNLSYATQHGIRKIEVENRSSSRLNIYVNGSKSSKTSFAQMFTDNDLYI